MVGENVEAIATFMTMTVRLQIDDNLLENTYIHLI